MFSIFFFLLFNLKNYQIIHCSQIDLHVPVVLLFKYFFRKKVIIRLSGASFYGDFARVKKLKGGSLILSAAKRVDKVVALTEEIEKELISNGFSRNKIIIIPNGVNIELFSPKKKSGSQSFLKICYIGRLEDGKGLEILISAFGSVKKKCSQARLVVVGHGSKIPELKQQIERLNLFNHIDLVGEKEDVLNYYHQSDILIAPSESEGMSNVLLEAMACGLPVIASDIGGNVELIGKKMEEIRGDEGTRYFICANGILVPPRDVTSLSGAILKLWDNRTLSEGMGCSARRIVEDLYTLDQVAEKYISLYEIL